MTDEGDVPDLNLGLRLELARRRLELNQSDFGQLLGISRRTVQDFEGSVREPKERDLIAWARVSGTSLVWLKTGQAANPEGGGLRVVRHQGLEPRTRCLRVVGDVEQSRDAGDPLELRPAA